MVGRIGRAHGLRGEVAVRLTTEVTERLDPGSRLLAGDRELVVSSSRPHQDRWIVAFEGVNHRSAAEALLGLELRAEAVAGDPEDLWIHEMVGAEVVELDGTARGRVESVEANPASDILVLTGGALVPLRFVIGWEGGRPDASLSGPRRLVVDAPVGLFD